MQATGLVSGVCQVYALLGNVSLHHRSIMHAINYRALRPTARRSGLDGGRQYKGIPVYHTSQQTMRRAITLDGTTIINEREVDTCADGGSVNTETKEVRPAALLSPPPPSCGQ